MFIGMHHWIYRHDNWMSQQYSLAPGHNNEASRACKVARSVILLGLQGCQDRNIARFTRLPVSQYCYACKVVKIAILIDL